jgi:hypothetical protein
VWRKGLCYDGLNRTGRSRLLGLDCIIHLFLTCFLPSDGWYHTLTWHRTSCFPTRVVVSSVTLHNWHIVLGPRLPPAPPRACILPRLTLCTEVEQMLAFFSGKYAGFQPSSCYLVGRSPTECETTKPLLASESDPDICFVRIGDWASPTNQSPVAANGGETCSTWGKMGSRLDGTSSSHVESRTDCELEGLGEIAVCPPSYKMLLSKGEEQATSKN